MKKIILSAIAVMSISGTVQAADTITDSLTNGKFTVDARVYYFDRSFDTDGKDNATALTAGGIMKYVSDNYMGLNAGLAYYSSNKIGGLYSKEGGVGTSALQSDGENINILGEAYLEYKIANTMLKVGRQGLSTPIINQYDARTAPTAFEAVIVQNKDIPDTTLEVGYVWASTSIGSSSNDFVDHDDTWGDAGLAYISVSNNSYKPLKVRAQYVQALSDTYDVNSTSAGTGVDISVTNYRYVDANYAVPFGEKTYVKAQYGGNTYQASGADNSLMIGAGVGTTVSIVDLALVFNQIKDNVFATIQAGPMYTDWQQGYGDYEPSTAFGGYAVVHPIDSLSLKGGYVVVSADEDSTTDDYSEINFDVKYAINTISNIRVRYSIKDVTTDSDGDDRTDFRVIYGVKF
ncbi:OprD family outer membrane porin [Sulfurimonas sp.]|uniref:OprD family outer membrane porin n=1 Tax=Sulfurimonas sp. TaxID=2022749 RepID=UPI0025D787FE|nr:OprD family outer membrane porin [Sulfurimonas sp.]